MTNKNPGYRDSEDDGITTAATIYCVALGALFVGGAVLSLLEKRKGRGR